MEFPASYYEKLARDYDVRRERLLEILKNAGFRCFKPRGAYYIMTDVSDFGFPSDVAFAKYLVQEIGVAAVPGSSFFRDPADGKSILRFTFCKKPETLTAAAERLSKLNKVAG
jgi:aspartate/methionine/tyrosine aminotransferase